MSQNNLSAELDNKQTLDEMDKALENLQKWRDNRPTGDMLQLKEEEMNGSHGGREGDSNDNSDSDSEDEEFKAHKLLYLQHCEANNSSEEEQPLTARVANEKTVIEDSLCCCWQMFMFTCADVYGT